MSNESSEIKLMNSNDDGEKFDAKYKPWNYPDSSSNTHPNQIRNCCSPIDEIEDLAKEDKNLYTTHNDEVQADKSTFSMLKQNENIDNNSKKSSNRITNSKEMQNDKQVNYLDKSNLRYRINEFESIKQIENYQQEKMAEKLPININSPEIFNKYVETDLDQPMDYTLCYDENKSDEEKKGSATFFPKNGNKIFSIDFLCIEETIEEDKIQTIKPKGGMNKEPTRNKKEMFSNTSRSFKEIFNFFKDRDKKRTAIDNTKISALDGSKLLKNAEIYEQKVEKSPQPQVEHCERDSKLRNDIQCSQQTPLMFSRCSSLGSLNGLEQNSTNDDRSSVISDVSHRTSGIISPSELPDSPAQAIPPNIRLQPKSQANSFVKKKIQIQNDKLKIYQHSIISNDSSLLHQENTCKKSLMTKGSVFEDNITSFKDESTPTKLHSVAASSLSSLTIDDDDDYELINKLTNKEKQSITEEAEIENSIEEPIEESNHLVKPSMEAEKSESESHEIDEDFIREQDDELTDLTSHEEQLLDQCIRRGIAKWTKQSINDIKPFSWDVGLTCRATRAMIISRIRINSDTDIYNHIDDKQENYQGNKLTNNKLNLKQKFQNEIEECKNYNGKYSNEDSDAIESLSNLKETSDQFHKNSYYITYEEHLLDQCIRRGMAKITKRNVNDIKPFSWDAHQICLTTRAMMLHSRDGDFHTSH
ncbi:PREDICTED: adenomatous polyposis coli protein-like [Ceratosolen solmsi marchali]|uniref:Adenomatous polyposis coli protein-like n=1 Tax=Ceratosolen solmsi marchali TaxID=326594 RepID=A0AAJ6YPH9_9HYME|nr:PREDICTED: adenomatous polyposis coli protein-like [Ceratosolen solmsi marchali]